MHINRRRQMAFGEVTTPMTFKQASMLAAELNKRWPHREAEYQPAVLDFDAGEFKVALTRTSWLPGVPVTCGESANGTCIHDKALGSMTVAEFVDAYKRGEL